MNKCIILIIYINVESKLLQIIVNDVKKIKKNDK